MYQSYGYCHHINQNAVKMYCLYFIYNKAGFDLCQTALKMS